LQNLLKEFPVDVSQNYSKINRRDIFKINWATLSSSFGLDRAWYRVFD